MAGTSVAVVGRDPSGESAAALLRRRGASVRLLDAVSTAPTEGGQPDLVVLSAQCPGMPDWVRTWETAGVGVMGERDLAFQEGLCLHVAVAGASGKSTTTDLIAHVLRSAGRRVEVACGPERPACAFVESSRELDLLVHGVDAAELDQLHFFRPVVAVLLNAPPDHGDGAGSRDASLRRWARLFARQQAFDWAIVQSEALAQLQAIQAAPPSKVISFSASSRQADLSVDRGLLVSRMEGWSGRLWDMARGRMRGPHFAEDALAALAVGRVLRLALDEMTHALESFVPGEGRFEFVGEADGVRFVDDSRSANLDALAKALLTLAPIPPEHPFIWLIAGGDLAGRQFYDLGPLLSPRVKHALVYGEAAQAMRAAWSLFTPCSPTGSLIDAARSAAGHAGRGDTVLLSPACPRGADPEVRLAERAAFRRIVQDRLHRAEASQPTSGLPPKAAGGKPNSMTTPQGPAPPPKPI